MEPTTTTDPIMYLITGGGAMGGYVLSRLLDGKNGNSELTAISQKIDQTNKRLNELLPFQSHVAKTSRTRHRIAPVAFRSTSYRLNSASKSIGS